MGDIWISQDEAFGEARWWLKNLIRRVVNFRIKNYIKIFFSTRYFYGEIIIIIYTGGSQRPVFNNLIIKFSIADG